MGGVIEINKKVVAAPVEKTESNGKDTDWKLFWKLMYICLGLCVLLIVGMTLVRLIFSSYTFGTSTTSGAVSTTTTNHWLWNSTTVTLLSYSGGTEQVKWIGGHFKSQLGQLCTFDTSGFNLVSYNCSNG